MRVCEKKMKKKTPMPSACTTIRYVLRSREVQSDHTRYDEQQTCRFLLRETFFEHPSTHESRQCGSSTAPDGICYRHFPLFQSDGKQCERDSVTSVHAERWPWFLETIAELHASRSAHFEEHRGQQRDPSGVRELESLRKTTESRGLTCGTMSTKSKARSRTEARNMHPCLHLLRLRMLSNSKNVERFLSLYGVVKMEKAKNVRTERR